MKLSFFTAIALLVPVGLFAAFLYMVGRSVASLYNDWRVGREVEAIRADSEARRARRKIEDAKRLDNGCTHAFGGGLGGFPPDVCPKCGLEREKPVGKCDHVWRRSHEAIPSSFCEKCGKKHQGSAFV
jgi:hypothetical protein